MAVRLDIRPRIVLRDEPLTGALRRSDSSRRFRLPPLTVPAVGYWLAMAALTYGFMRLGEHPLDSPRAEARAASRPPADSWPNGRSEPLSGTPAAPARLAALAPALPSEAEQAPTDSRKVEPPPPLAAPAGAALSSEPSAPRERRGLDASLASEPAPPGQALAPEPTRPVAPHLDFPEFTDSSRPERAYRAGDGPRIDSDLFSARRGEERPSAAAPTDTAPARDTRASAVSASCEAAVARYQEEITIGAARGAPDVTREAYAAILENGRYLSACSIPERTVFEVCAAVLNGQAVGVTVVSNPSSPQVNACVRRAVSSLRFPQSSRLDVTHTRFGGTRH